MAQVTILIPCYNEEKFISRCLDSLVDDYVQTRCEILILDGMSTDKTSTIIQEYQDKYDNIFFFANRGKKQAYGLNLGLEKANGSIIVRIDSHSIYPKNYVRDCVELLKKTGASNVGGAMLPRGMNFIQKIIADAMTHPIGVGDAKFHLGNYNGYVDTVYLGTFWREVFERVGMFDTNAHPNEDSELNIRILKNGKKIFIDRSIKVSYYPRDSIRKLVKQYFWYGRGRCYTIKKHKKITSIRQLAPPALIIALMTSLALTPLHILFLVFPFSYFLTLFFISFYRYKMEEQRLKKSLLLALIFSVMHLAWGTGFLAKLLNIIR